jgi:hypothetical protein
VALELSNQQLKFFEDDFNGKKSLRTILEDSKAKYNLPVVGRELRELYRSNGIQAVISAMPASGNIHVRLGLARAWSGQAKKCFAMVNGVTW